MTEELKPHPVGTRIRFTKYIGDQADGDHPALTYAEKGEVGEVTGHGYSWPYLVKTDSWPNAFAASEEEFEVLP